MSTSSTNTTTATNVIPGRPTWAQSMLRISDPVKSVKHYQNVYGMTLLDEIDFPQYNFKLFFLTSLPTGGDKGLAKPGSEEAHANLWKYEGVTLELTYNYNSDGSAAPSPHPGNMEKDGFGHIAFNTNDVYEVCGEMVNNGIQFKKLPDEGRMKGLAFAYDEDKYWVEIIKRSEVHKIANRFNLSQTMIR